MLLDYYFDSDLESDDDPGVINCGWCYIWAHIVYKLYGGKLYSIYVNDKLHHAVIKLGNKYYDSEHLLGEEEIHDLNSVRHRSGVIWWTEDSVKDFFSKWNYKPDNDLFLYGISNFGLERIK